MPIRLHISYWLTVRFLHLVVVIIVRFRRPLLLFGRIAAVAEVPDLALGLGVEDVLELELLVGAVEGVARPAEQKDLFDRQVSKASGW